MNDNTVMYRNNLCEDFQANNTKTLLSYCQINCVEKRRINLSRLLSNTLIS